MLPLIGPLQVSGIVSAVPDTLTVPLFVVSFIEPERVPFVRKGNDDVDRSLLNVVP
jgi:hypothetical protein